MRGRDLRTPRSDEQGTAIVEFALIVPVLILLVAASLDIARALNVYVTIASASREAASFAALHPMAAPSDIRKIVASRSIAALDTSPNSLCVNAFYDNDQLGFRPWPDSPTPGVPPTSPTPTLVPIRIDVSYRWQAISVAAAFFPMGTDACGSGSASVFRSTATSMTTR